MKQYVEDGDMREQEPINLHLPYSKNIATREKHLRSWDEWNDDILIESRG